mmetsp:Transcript_86764/g.136885  ORF Transcript_86764/g.136885 Transcript_86764/m.136885 type:complete len:198 (+) Transcript_86764:130-723(+)
MACCSFQGFFSFGGLWVFLISIIATLILASCPYSNHCPFGMYCLIFLGPVSLFQGCLMMNIGWSIAHVEKLTLDQLNPDIISSGTKRWGWIAKSCPTCSRGNHILVGVTCLIGLAIAGGVCTEKVPAGEVCNATMMGLAPDPLRDFGILFALWSLLGLAGCSTNKKNNHLPHIYEPTPADGNKVVGAGCCVGQMCHP